MAVPKNMTEKYNEIAALIIAFCDKKLNTEYKYLSLKLLEKLCRKRPSPLLKGRANSWACGIVYAIGSNNFIFDKSQKIHMTSAELADGFGISASTAGNKATEIRNMVGMTPFNTEWMLCEMIEQSSVIWMVQVNGFIVDIRNMPLEMQQQAFEMGIIPYIPENQP